MIVQLFSMVGAFALLAAYFINNTDLLPSKNHALWLNLLGSFILTITATIEYQYGFIVLEAAWTLISIHSIIKFVRNKS